MDYKYVQQRGYGDGDDGHDDHDDEDEESSSEHTSVSMK